MAISVTTTTTSASNADSLTITKPTGVSIGETLLIVANGNGSNYASVTGFTQILTSNRGSSPDASLSLLYRIADASDVSASNYTINLPETTSQGAAAMFRVTGLSTGNPLYASATASDIRDASSWTLTSGTLSLSRPSEQLLIMAGQFNGDEDPATFSNYTITSGNSNPSWTEVLDVNYATNNQPADESLFVAYAITSNTSTITGYSVDVSASSSGTSDGLTTFLAVIVEPISVTVSNALHQTSPVTFATLTGSTQTPGNDFHEVEPEIFEQSAAATNPTVWANETHPGTTWVNESL